MAGVSVPLADLLRDHYTIERELGQGGMAVVYRAWDLERKQPVALKVLRPGLVASLGPERFLREIRLTAQLEHPQILPLFDSGNAGGQLWFTMPYVDGETLRDRLSRELQLPLHEAVRIAREVADGLDYAHQHGIVHRDIKPENILLSGGRTLIADFGIAKALGEAAGSKLTETGLVIGTAAYMSPEQAAADPIDARTDIYSLGCVLYEMLAGEPPFAGPTGQAMIAKRMAGPPRFLRIVRPDAPGEVDEALQRALAPDPDDRFESAAAFARALVEPLPHQPVAAQPWPRVSRPVAQGATVVLPATPTIQPAESRPRATSARRYIYAGLVLLAGLAALAMLLGVFGHPR
jgi:eukaryotic-like serine/threonine-protein kinase